MALNTNWFNGMVGWLTGCLIGEWNEKFQVISQDGDGKQSYF